MLNFVSDVCHSKQSFTDFGGVKYISGFLFIKEGGDRSHSSPFRILTGDKICKLLEERHEMTAGIYSRLVMPYLIVLPDSCAAAKQ